MVKNAGEVRIYYSSREKLLLDGIIKPEVKPEVKEEPKPRPAKKPRAYGSSAAEVIDLS